jgi:hypothetical protein
VWWIEVPKAQRQLEWELQIKKTTLEPLNCSVPLIPNFASEPLPAHANFGSGHRNCARSTDAAFPFIPVPAKSAGLDPKPLNHHMKMARREATLRVARAH